MKNKKCPNCNSENTRIIGYLSIKGVKCNDCGYDETKQYEVYPEEKKSQKEKGRFTPYKSGGSKRSKK